MSKEFAKKGKQLWASCNNIVIPKISLTCVRTLSSLYIYIYKKNNFYNKWQTHKGWGVSSVWTEEDLVWYRALRAGTPRDGSLLWEEWSPMATKNCWPSYIRRLQDCARDTSPVFSVCPADYVYGQNKLRPKSTFCRHQGDLDLWPPTSARLGQIKDTRCSWEFARPESRIWPWPLVFDYKNRIVQLNICPWYECFSWEGADGQPLAHGRGRCSSFQLSSCRLKLVHWSTWICSASYYL